MALSLDILTLFPGMFPGVVGESIIARAVAADLVRISFTDIREFASGRHRSVDDRPYGGGPGMVFKPEPVLAAVESVLAAGRAAPEATRRLIMTPQGGRLTQAHLRGLAAASWIVILCGHYEGFDERILDVLREEQGFEEVSVGDFVLSGGEVAAMVVLDGVVRLLPGALGDPESADRESFEYGLLDYPQYTRPPEYRGLKVPEVLLSGDHGRIAAWRRDQALRRTRERRGDLLAAAPPPAGQITRSERERGVPESPEWKEGLVP
jgi:tRNA (guanine37-N1)-methyltransferase